MSEIFGWGNRRRLSPMPVGDACCGLQMQCENLAFCLKQDMLRDPSVMDWMRMTPPPSLPLHSAVRVEATRQLAVQESHLRILNAKLDDARRQVEAVHKLVEDILIQIKQARLHITMSHASLAPIRCLPNEILRHILASVEPPELPDSVEKAAMLFCVSKRWNQAARATPELWTKWQLYFGYLNSELTDNTVWSNLTGPAHVDEFLLKSAPRPLDISIISVYNSSYRTYVETPPHVLNAIFQSFPRCRRLKYHCHEWEDNCFCPQILAELNRFTSLGDLSWTSCIPAHWSHFEQKVPISIQLEELRRLTVQENTTILSRLHIPNLSDLSLVGLSLNTKDLSNLAASLPRLLVLRCRNVTFHSEDTERHSPIRFQRLRDFHMTGGYLGWESVWKLAGAVIHDSTTLINIYRNIRRLRDFDGMQNLRPGLNISYVEFELDVCGALFWDRAATAVSDWLLMTPNLRTLVLKWEENDSWGRVDNRNNVLAANILHCMSTSKRHGPCGRLKYLKCHGAAFEGVSTTGSGTRIFLMHLENFIYYRSAERSQLNGTEPCLVSLNWHHGPDSPHLPELVDASWEEVRELLDLLPEEEGFSDDDVTEASECSWIGEDLDVDDSDWSEGEDSTDYASEVEEGRDLDVEMEMEGMNGS